MRGELVSFVATTDLEASHAFYGGVLGLERTDASPFANVYGDQLRVTTAEEVHVAPYTVLGWNVTDVSATVAHLLAKGVAFNHYDGMDQDELGIWTAPSGARIAWFRDPDGNVLSVQQL